MPNFHLFTLLNDLIKQGYIKNTLVKVKSQKDVDIIVSTVSGNERFTRGIIEANIYTKRELNVKSVKQHGENIMYLTNNGETIKIDVVSEEELNDLEKEIVVY